MMGGLSSQDNAPRRLSKPRTNTSSSNLLNTFSDHETEATSSPLNSPEINYFGDHAAVVSSQGERRSRRKSRNKIRVYLYGGNDEAIQNSSEDEEGRSVLAATARSVKKRLSRTGSSIMQLQSAKASSAYLSKSDSQGSDPEEPAMIAVQIKEKAHNDSLAAKNHVASSVDDKRHVDSVMAPVRRKSLYMPGIATRNASDILRKPPPPDALQPQIDRDYYYNPARPETSPLSQLAAMNLSEDGRGTPSSINYPQLGGLLLGTLRVTNGIPRNDTPDLLARSHTPESKNREEYFTASEGSAIGNISATMTPSNLSPQQIQKELQEIFGSVDGLATPQESSVIRKVKTDAAAHMAHEYMAELDGSPFSYSETTIPRQRQDQDGSLDDEGIVIPEAEDPEVEKWRQLINDAGSSNGGNHTTEDAFRKLNGNMPSVLEIKRLSVPSSMTSRYSVSNETPKTDSGYSSNSSFTASAMTSTTIDAEGRYSRAPPANLQRRSRCLSGARERPESILKQGDYMSQPTRRVPISNSSNVIPCHTLPSSPAELCSSLSSQTIDTIRLSARSSTRTSSQNLVRKLQKPRSKSQPPPVVQGHRDLELANIPCVPSVIAARHADRLRQFSLLDHTFPSSQHTTAEEGCSAIAIHPMPIRFPSPANALEAATSDPYAAPTILEERKILRPQALSRYRSREYSDGDQSPQAAIVRSPSWSEFGGGKNRKEHKRLAKEEKRNEKSLSREERELAKRLEKNKKQLENQIKKESKQRASRSRSASRTRTKSSDCLPSQYDTLVTIPDFGTVTQSLGGSPYDITTSMFSSVSQNTPNTHPHQISNAMPRPRSMVGMDEAVAAEAARARSRARSQINGRPTGYIYGDDGDLSEKRLRPSSMLLNDVHPVPALAAVDIKAHDLQWARSRRRSQSFSGAKIEFEGPFNDRGGVPGRSIRPSSIIMDVPPVPALPSVQQVKQREAQITRSRPHSITVRSSPALTLPQIEKVDTQNIDPSNLRPDISISRKTKANKLVPELWSSGSLEKKTPRAVERLRADCDSIYTPSNEDQSNKEKSTWDAQRQAWSQRRKSAGEALLKNRASRDVISRLVDPDNSHMQQKNSGPSSTLKIPTAEPRYSHEPRQLSRPGPSPLAPSRTPPAPPQLSPQQQVYKPESSSSPYTSNRPGAHDPLISQQPSRPSPSPPTNAPIRHSQAQAQVRTPAGRRAQTQDSFPIPRKRLSSGTSILNPKIDSLTGRYAGGLMYGYEPGCGLGGSAGTRSAKTQASRKSVDVSRGFGIDLSDVPIFVAPNVSETRGRNIA